MTSAASLEEGLVDKSESVSRDKRYIFKVERKEELNPLIYRYTFKAANPGV